MAHGLLTLIQEFPYLSEIKKEFKEEKDLFFLYLGKDRSAPGEIVFTSGIETSQKLSRDGSLEEMIKVEFFRTWTKKYGVWKITTKTHSDPIK